MVFATFWVRWQGGF